MHFLMLPIQDPHRGGLRETYGAAQRQDGHVQTNLQSHDRAEGGDLLQDLQGRCPPRKFQSRRTLLEDTRYDAEDLLRRPRCPSSRTRQPGRPQTVIQLDEQVPVFLQDLSKNILFLHRRGEAHVTGSRDDD